MHLPLVRSNKEVNVPARLFISSLFFGTGWFSLSFTFPLLAQSIGYSYVIIGALGFIAALPFPIVAYIYLKSTPRMLRYGTLVPLVSLTVLSGVFYFFYRPYFIPLTIISCIVQSPWWIATEISLGSFSGEKNAEKYSAGWGIPNAIAPIFMGIILELSGYDLVFIISMLAFIIAVMFSPKPGKFKETEGKASVQSSYLLSLFFAGLFSGFVYFVMEPVLKASSFSYVTIGAMASLYGLVAAIGYVLLHYTKNRKISTYSALSSLLLFPTAFIGLSISLYTIIIAVVLAGFGVSISMSKVLAYISESSDIRWGVFLYETFFGTGFMCGSLLQDFLYQYFGKITIFLLFLLPLFYGIGITFVKEHS